MRELSVGARYGFRGLSMLTTPGIRRFVLVPLLINIAVFGSAIWWLSRWLAPRVSGWVESAVSWLPTWLDWLAGVLSALMWLVFGLGALVAVFYTFSAVANLLAAPFNGLLAEKVEAQLTGKSSDSGVSIWKEIAVAPMQELRKMLYFLLWAVPLAILFLIPGLNLAAPFLWALFSAWMLALQYLDYPLGNHAIRFSAQRAMIRERRSLGLGFGAAVLLMTLVPVLNFLAMPAAVVGATALWVERLRPEAG
jgi:CysZ protein